MKKFLTYCLLFLLPFTAGIIILFNQPYDKKFAYHYIEDNCFDRGSWIYDRIFENNTPVDIAFIGTSHTLNAINDSLLNHLQQEKNLHIANLGFCWQGYNAEYVILKDLFENKHPQTIVLELREWTENDNHIIFPYIAETEDILRQPWLSKPACISNFYTAGLSRWEYFRFGNKKLDVNQSANSVFGFIPAGDSLQQRKADVQIQFQNKRFSADGTHLNNKVKDFDAYYLNKIIELCAVNNADLCFLYLPAYGDILHHPVDETFFKQYPILIPDEDILGNRSNWSNTSHLNERGAAALTQWLAGSELFEDRFLKTIGNN